MSSSKKTVLVVTGGRAEYGLLRPLMREILKSKKLTLRVLATGMHTLKKHGYTVDFIKADKIPLDCVVGVGEEDTMLDSLAKEIQGIADYCAKHRPDLIVVLGDRDEPFAAAIVGGHLGIPVAHLHGGDKTGYVVDEYIRHAITKFSHLHFPATRLSASRIKKLGEEPWRIMTVGGTGLDEMRDFSFESKQAIGQKYGLDPLMPWYIVLHHPASLDSVPYTKQAKGAFRAAMKLKGEKLISLPNADMGSKDFMREIGKYRGRKNVHIHKSLPRKDFLNIFKYTDILIGNSSMGIIDSSFFRIPVVNIGNRQLGREHGINVVHAGYDEKSIVRAITKVSNPAFLRRVKNMKSPYGDGRASKRIVRHLERLVDKKDLFYKKLTYV
jgi:GDP/UDP-N,N'-diacetylbacillosamine 2-epimerase (hydrolysing)